jgi:hypothetical protein
MDRTKFSLSSNFLFPLCVSTFGSIQQFRIAQDKQQDIKRPEGIISPGVVQSGMPSKYVYLSALRGKKEER